MPYSDSLAERVRGVLARKRGVREKRMFGGLVFLLHGNMLAGIWHDSLIARLGLAKAATALAHEHVVPFDVTGKPMRGWVLIQPDGLESDDCLRQWLDDCLQFVRTLPPKA